MPCGTLGRILGLQPMIEVLSLGLFDVGELSVALPIIAAQSGADLGFIGRPGEQVASRAVGDIVLTPKLQLWDGSDRRFFGFGAAGAGGWVFC